MVAGPAPSGTCLTGPSPNLFPLGVHVGSVPSIPNSPACLRLSRPGVRGHEPSKQRWPSCLQLPGAGTSHCFQAPSWPGQR